jgi:hypothetical protein
MWANVWYYLGTQLIVLATAFVMCLCFESPFIRLEKLWIGALLQSLLPSNKTAVQQNGKMNEHNTEKILDDIIERLEKEETEGRRVDDSPKDNPNEKKQSNALDEKKERDPEMGDKTKVYSKEEEARGDILSATQKETDPTDHRISADNEPGSVAFAVAEIHVDTMPPTYEQTIKE